MDGINGYLEEAKQSQRCQSLVNLAQVTYEKDGRGWRATSPLPVKGVKRPTKAPDERLSSSKGRFQLYQKGSRLVSQCSGTSGVRRLTEQGSLLRFGLVVLAK